MVKKNGAEEKHSMALRRKRVSKKALRISRVTALHVYLTKKVQGFDGVGAPSISGQTHRVRHSSILIGRNKRCRKQKKTDPLAQSSFAVRIGKGGLAGNQARSDTQTSRTIDAPFQTRRW